ncbi:DNA polymerase III alpha subunit [Bdellovibrio bacteriovorus HD100]|uniref:DNA polymerase III alpha subunit n=2 Tax=Bdellovibrio bacteriovorus TaxID=959 RepID=Q6MGT7_BDEBA|nr:DNA polymerase III subunit alpha [Bdellovibrio bacteriovorus]CAE81192.1 DNA polymerase III alpha subunit [Bdellovibrio bacteriovorus HD100]
MKQPHPFCINVFMRFIAFDLETTGTVPGVDQIVEIGAVRFIDGQPEAIFATLIDPLRPIPPGASAVNGISDDMVKGKPLIDTILPAFAEFCGEDVLVAHNAPFDSQFLIADIKKHETTAPRGVILDSLPIARKVFPGLPNYKLGTLVQHLKIPTSNFHRAEEDATYLGHMFSQMMKRISIGGQAPQVGNLIALTGKPELRFPQIVRQPKQMDFFGGL